MNVAVKCLKYLFLKTNKCATFHYELSPKLLKFILKATIGSREMEQVRNESFANREPWFISSSVECTEFHKA